MSPGPTCEQKTWHVHPTVVPALSILLLMCGSLGFARESCEERALHSESSMRIEDLGQWEPLDAQTLLVWASHSSRAHLLRLRKPLAGLMDTDVVALIDGDHDELISPCGHDALMVDEDAAEIISIEYLSEQRTAELDKRGSPSLEL
ncbi:MAG TPA: DUF6491 family protein [Steroidobacteraceae bacterium]|nr:DUF6491 family protein [Steroidobacteraceae bacterium]